MLILLVFGKLVGIILFFSNSVLDAFLNVPLDILVFVSELQSSHFKSLDDFKLSDRVISVRDKL